MSDFFLIAKIVSLQGKDGFVNIISYSDFPDRFYKLDKVYIDFFEDKKEFLVEKVLEQKKEIALKFRNFDSDKDAQILIGRGVFVDEEKVIRLPKGSYFIHDLLGSKVYRNGEKFGSLKDVLRFPANDVYVIEDTRGEEILIPAIKDYIESFDREKKILVIKPGDEIYEDDEN